MRLDLVHAKHRLINPRRGLSVPARSESVVRMKHNPASASNLNGPFCEGGLWPAALNSTQYGNLNSKNAQCDERLEFLKTFA
jgi:hypothetical protein